MTEPTGPLTVLGVETSCDETAAAVVRRGADGRVAVLSSVIASQIAAHAPFGGVVPEIAARAHVEIIDDIIRRAMAEAGLIRLRVMGCSYAFSALMDCTIAASRGLGRSLVPTVIVILGSCVFRVIWVYTVFARFHTIPSLYLLYICSWTLTGAAEVLSFIHAYRVQTRALPQGA